MKFKPRCMATAIGSLPHTDAAAGVELILSSTPEAPIWPQLPARGMNELMEVQYSEGIPRRVIDREKSRMYFNTSGDYSEEFAAFYETWLAAMDPESGNGDCSSLAISPDFSAGIYALEKRLSQEGKKRPFVKCHTIGPCTFTLSVMDENKRALYYNEEFRDVVTKAMAMKSRWQIQKFKPYADNIICFLDEPIFAGFGSSTYISVHRADVVAILKEALEAIHAEGAISGIHCCGNTEWSILTDAGVDIVSFDAFQFGETISMYPLEVRQHLEKGGALAWGVVPTSEAIREQTVEGLIAHFDKVVDLLVEKSGVDRRLVLERSLVTPSCGTGCLEVRDAEKVFGLLNGLSQGLREKYGME